MGLVGLDGKDKQGLNMKKVMTVLAIRPDIPRLYKTIRLLDSDPNIDHILVASGQHYDANLFSNFLKEFDVRQPDYNLGVGAPGKPAHHQIADLMGSLTDLCLKINPDLVVFLGDSNSVVASIGLHRAGFKVAHIEGGMRSSDFHQPEECNRKAIDHVSSIIFAYHPNYVKNLTDEKIPAMKTVMCGNTIVEAVKEYADLAYQGAPQHIGVDIHRQENLDSPDSLSAIIKTLNYYHKTFKLPIKMLGFKRTLDALKLFKLDLGSVEIVDLMGYRDYLRFQQDSAFLVSDSGTASEEAPLLKVPVIVPRWFTERWESVNAGCSFMMPPGTDNWMELAKKSLVWFDSFDPSKNDLSWLGDGKTSETIVHNIKKFLEIK